MNTFTSLDANSCNAMNNQIIKSVYATPNTMSPRTTHYRRLSQNVSRTANLYNEKNIDFKTIAVGE